MFWDPATWHRSGEMVGARFREDERVRIGIRVGIIVASMIPVVAIGALAVVAVVSYRHNVAEEPGKALGAAIIDSGGDPICEDGDGGHGPSNTEPWYEAFHDFDDPSQALLVMTETAADAGFSLEPGHDVDGNPYELSGGGLVLIGESNGSRLEVSITETEMGGLWCVDKAKGEGTPKPGHAITRFLLVYPQESATGSAK